MQSGPSPLPKLRAHKYVLLESIPDARSVPVLGRENTEITPPCAETVGNNQIAINTDLLKRNRKDMAISAEWPTAI
jgi:hypothetical protein